MAAAPAAKPPATAPAPAEPIAPRSGDLRDVGASIRDRVRARSWTILGKGRTTKDVDVEELRIEGDLAVGTVVAADRCECDGRLSSGGEARGSGPWGLRGESRIGGALRVGALSVEGRLDIHGDLAVAGALQSTGTLDVRGSIRAQSIHLDGNVAALSEVSAPEVSFVIRGPSKIAALRSRRVVIRRPAPPWASDPATLDVLEIEATEAHLAGVVAQYVKADKIAVGPGCQLARVDGAIISQSPRSHVGPQSKSAPPKGLSR